MEDVVPLSELVNRVFGKIYYRENHPLIEYSTGVYEIDHNTLGLKEGEFWIIGGRPGAGKTSLLLHMVNSLSTSERLSGKIPSIIISTKESEEKILEKLVSAYYQINLNDNNDVPKREIERYISAFYNISESLITLTYQPKLSRDKFNEIVEENDAKYIFIDDIDYVEPKKRFIKRIADLTIEKKLSVVAASGLSSRVGSNIPRIYNLNNSLADSAKKVLLLYREVANYPESFEIEKNMIEVFIAKNNSGSLGKALLLFKPEFGRIENKTQTLK